MKLSEQTRSVSHENALRDRRWVLIDASERPLGRVATRAASVLRGKHRPDFTPHQDAGDFVIIINAGKVRLTGAKLEGKVVAVTGAGRGIGREIALLCAREGARVVVNDFGGAADGEGSDVSPANEVVAAIHAAGGQALANFASVADGPSEENPEALAAWGLIHGLSALFIDGLVPEPHVRSLAEEVFVRWREAV